MPVNVNVGVNVGESVHRLGESGGTGAVVKRGLCSSGSDNWRCGCGVGEVLW